MMRRERNTSVKTRKEGRKDVDKASTLSVNSRNSMDRQRSLTSRFSLRRLFTPRRYRIKSKSTTETEYFPETVTPPLDNDGQSLPSTPRGELIERKKSMTERECPLCLSEQPIENFPDIITCHHRSCRECLRQYLKIEITESRVNIACPECSEKFHPNDIKTVLQDEALMQKYEDFMVRRVLVSDPDSRWCPAPDCGYVVIASGCAGCPKIKCERPGCDTYFCYHCKQHWHPNQTCDAARAKRSPNMRSASLSYEGGQSNDIKPCPRCGAFIIKMNDGSCNHMTCAVCGAEFCWLCMKEISDLHYLSPSGCTFWGKKPWSRKKKILWQLGTLVGAPIGISLVAGIAVPALIIGIPVWVFRKINNRYEHSSKHKRNIAITGGVSASIIVSPIIAGLAVGIGVPVLLAYVYGVVPISLCRSGGCGVTTTEAGGVRFEFDENQEGSGANSAYGGDNQSVETAQNVPNPSIAPSIGEASVGMTNSLSASGSHLDRVGILRDESDHESASNRAIAGSSLNGSICDSTLGATSALYHNKMEVQADVSTNPQMSKRASLSSESANFSIGEKSMTVSFSDDASTRALAGSIAGNRDKDSLSLISPSFEVQVDIVTGPRGRNNSGSSYATVADKSHQKAVCDQSSPTSTRSVNFAVDDVRTPHDRCRKCKRFSVSVGERINEHTDKGQSDSISMQSFPGSCLKKRHPFDNVSLPSSCDGAGTTDSSRKATPRTSPSCDSMDCADGAVVSPTSLTQVESDRPVLGATVNTRGFTNDTLTIDESVEMGLGRQTEEEEDGGCRPSPLRRRSCELAMQQGRLSPHMMEQKVQS